MLAGVVDDDELRASYPDLAELRERAERGGAPLQWVLCAEDLPLVRDLLATAAIALCDLLLALGEAELGAAEDGCWLGHALLHAPQWLARPATMDSAHPDIALLLERDEHYHGDWDALIEALHGAGSVRWQEAIQRCRAMQRFERARGVSLCGLLLAQRDAPLEPSAADDLRYPRE